MYDFVKVTPIESDDDIEEFVSIDDILNRWMERDRDLKRVAIYSVDGNCIGEKEIK